MCVRLRDKDQRSAAAALPVMTLLAEWVSEWVDITKWGKVALMKEQFIPGAVCRTKTVISGQQDGYSRTTPAVLIIKQSQVACELTAI